MTQTVAVTGQRSACGAGVAAEDRRLSVAGELSPTLKWFRFNTPNAAPFPGATPRKVCLLYDHSHDRSTEKQREH